MRLFKVLMRDWHAKLNIHRKITSFSKVVIHFCNNSVITNVKKINISSFNCLHFGGPADCQNPIWRAALCMRLLNQRVGGFKNNCQVTFCQRI